MNRPRRLRVLVVDDEPAARRLLRSMLEAEPGVEVAGECRDGQAAVDWLETHDVDVLFLDIHMPRLDGFRVLESLEPGKLPPVVFVTAYDEFAVRAFSVQAWDYLLKPFDSERLQQTLVRVRARLAQQSAEPLSERLAGFLRTLTDPPIERLAVRKGKARVSIRTADIDWIGADSNYVLLHVGGDSYLARTSLAALEAKLEPRLFVRIHRSVIVNVDRVERLEPVGHGDLSVTLKDGQQLNLSRRYRQRIESVLEMLA